MMRENLCWLCHFTLPKLFSTFELLEWLCSSERFECARCNAPLIKRPECCRNCGQPILYEVKGRNRQSPILDNRRKGIILAKWFVNEYSGQSISSLGIEEVDYYEEYVNMYEQLFVESKGWDKRRKRKVYLSLKLLSKLRKAKK